jgi:hypothetical protein
LNAIQYLVRIWLEKRNEKRLRAQGILVDWTRRKSLPNF